MLKGKCALITGSTAGLGYAIASRLASEGCNIVLNGFASANDIHQATSQLEQKHGVGAIYNGADLRKPEEIAAMVRAAADKFGTVDILVNNAVVRYFSPVETFPQEQWEHALTVNLSAAFHAIKHVLPLMRKNDFGRIINMSSVAGLRGIADRVDYVTTKTGLIGMARGVALETLGTNITCNALCPHSVLTPYSDNRIKGIMADEGLSREEATRKFLSNRQPAGRFVEADSVAAMVAFLCGPAGRDITGAALPIDIGWTSVSRIE
jgi:3-hydroxybutyrate dehydrogenase